MEKRIPFYKTSIDGGIIDLNYNFKMGSPIDRLEKEINNTFNLSNSLSLGSSSAAMHLAMCALDLKRGDKVICPVNSFVDIPESVRHFDSEPIFVDIDPKRYTILTDELERTIIANKSKKLRAVVVTHFAGLAANIDEIKDIAKKHNLAVIEDATDSLGLEINGRYAGSIGDIGVYSFEYKLCRYISGGLLATSNEEYFERAKLLSNHALIYENEDIYYLYDIKDIGCDYRMSELNSIICYESFKKFRDNIKRRREIAAIYRRELDGVAHITLPVEDKDHIYHYFIIEIDKNRDAFARELKKRGVEVGLHYVPLHLTKYYKEKYNLKIFDFPNALHIFQKTMSLPIYPLMSNDDVLYVCEAIKEVAKHHI